MLVSVVKIVVHAPRLIKEPLTFQSITQAVLNVDEFSFLSGHVAKASTIALYFSFKVGRRSLKIYANGHPSI